MNKSNLKPNLRSKSTTELSKSKKKEKKQAKRDVGELLKAVSSVGALPTLTVPTDRIKLALTTTYPVLNSPYTDSGGESDYDTDGGKGPRSRKGSRSGASGYDLQSYYSRQSGLTSNDSISSDTSSVSHLTQRELIAEIARRALKHKAPPDYILPLNELDPSLLSWNRKLPANAMDRDDPPINIIGCLHPIELILAKADHRLRKRAKALVLKQKKSEDRIKEIDDSIKWKFSRAERYAAIQHARELQSAWIRLVLIGRYMSLLRAKYIVKVSAELKIMKTTKYARIVIRAFRRWYRKHLFRKIQYNYNHAFDRVDGQFKLQLRIFRKRRAVKKLIRFLTDFKGHHKMNIVVHKYIQSVKRVQRSMKDFLQCKDAKIIAINSLWEKLEIQYIRKKLEARRKRLAEMQVAKKSSDQKFSDMDNKAFIEMKQQAQLWSKIDNKMEAMVANLRTAGVIVDEDENEVINRLLIPYDQRIKCIKAVIERIRKEYYVGQRSILRKKVEMDATFKEHHALQLLRGQTDNLNRIINEKFNKKLVNMKYKPFMFFTALDRKMVWDKMREAHQINETFKIKIRSQNAGGDEKKPAIKTK